MPRQDEAPGLGAPFNVEPSAPHTYTFVLLHGLGSNGHKFGAELLETGLTSTGQSLTQLFPGARFIFPTSRRRRSSAFRRSVITQWFDIARLPEPSHRQELQLQGLAESGRDILHILNEEVKKVPPGNVILGGLSQGCAMSLAALLCLEFPLGGYIGMSGYLCYQSELKEAVVDEDGGEDDFFSREEDGESKPQDAAVKSQTFERDLLGLQILENPDRQSTSVQTPVFLGHGGVDEKVPCALGEAAAGTLREAEYYVEWKCYEGQGHWYKIPEEIDDVVDFVRSRVGWDVAAT